MNSGIHGASHLTADSVDDNRNHVSPPDDDSRGLNQFIPFQGFLNQTHARGRGLHQRQANIRFTELHEPHHGLERDRVDLAERGFPDRDKLQLQLARELEIPFKEGIAKRMHFARHDVCDGGDDAFAANAQHGQHMIVVSAVDIALRAERGDVDNLLNIAAGLLGPDDVFVRAELRHGLREHIQTGSAGHIIDENRGIHGVCNREIVANQARLRGLVVVWGDDEQPVHADCLGGFAVGDYLFGVISTSAGDDRNATIDALHNELNDAQPLIERERGALAGGGGADDCVRMVCNLQFDQPGKCRKINRPVLKRGNDCDGAAAKDRHKRLRLPLTNKFLGNLHGVGCRALSNVVRNAPEVDSVFHGEVAAETAHIDGVGVRGIDRHGVESL
ncbi:hypothetical protein SDC9_125961 [bioreactor metagenome]|uniref:Uncharacterized protein n=1 Tax=bioreactor metagenome TaxID=1076179 RepID=A0A645CPF7_9ZZZZ